MVQRRAVVGVMGGAKVSAEMAAQARELGGLIARRGWVLLNGGRDAGVMAASAAGAHQAGGTVIGILPDADASRAAPHVTHAIVTGMGDARNVVNVLSSDVIIACAGGAGTLSEVALALKSGKRVILLGLPAAEPLESYRRSGLLTAARDPSDAVDQAAKALAEQGMS